MTDERRPDGDAQDPTVEGTSDTAPESVTDHVAEPDEVAPDEVAPDEASTESDAVTPPEALGAPDVPAGLDVPAEPEVGEPETAEPEVGEPETAEPEVGEPETAEPETAESEGPAADENLPPAADAQPSVVAPGAEGPDEAAGGVASDGAPENATPLSAQADDAVVDASEAERNGPAQDEAPAPVTDTTGVPAQGDAAVPAEGDAAVPAEGDAAVPAEGDTVVPAEDDTAVWTPQSWTRPQASSPADQDVAAPSDATGSPARASTSAEIGTEPEARSGAAGPTAVPERVSARPAPAASAPAEQAGAGSGSPGVGTGSASPERPVPDGSRSSDAVEAGRGVTPERGGSPMDVFPDERRPRRWHRVLGLVAAVLVVLGGAYVGTLWLWAERVPPGATVAGVEIGGLEADEAVARLDESLRAATTEPIPVAAGEKRTTFDPVTAGLGLDTGATVAQVTGFSLEPARLWTQVFGVGAVEPVTEVDDEALAAAVTVLEDSLATPAVDGTVLFVDATPQVTDAVEGMVLDRDGATELLVDGWLTASRPVDLPTVVTEPDITQDEVDRAVDTLAGPLARAPVVVAVGEQLAELPVGVVTAAATFVPQEGALELVMDGAALVEAVVVRTTDLLTSPADASFEFHDGAPVIVGGVQGTTLDPEHVGAAVAAAATGPDRTARVDLVEVDPAQTTAELEGLGVTTKVAEFSTPLTNDSDRNHNLTLGASRVNGTLLRPDDVFSLTDALAPITTTGGYRQAGVVVNGVLTQGTGGGLSQMGTTVYNAGFFAGLEDVEHRPHSYYFSRYPEGREATIYDGVLDVKMGNNTPYGVLLQSWVAGGRLHVAVWSTPYWTVEHSTSGRSGIVAPKTVYNTSAGCISQSAGNPGFMVTVTRRLLLEGEVQHEESNSWRYQPQNAIVCGPAPDEQPSAG